MILKSIDRRIPCAMRSKKPFALKGGEYHGKEEGKEEGQEDRSEEKGRQEEEEIILLFAETSA